MSTKDDCPECGVSPEDINRLTDEIDQLRQRVTTAERERDEARNDTVPGSAAKFALLESQVAHFRAHYDEAKKRTEYPEFCKHPGKCAGAGRCMAEWCCND